REKLPHMSQHKDENQLTPGRALLIGVLQVFALIPGTSRSGTTIIAGRIAGMDSESSAEYSFLASIPIM
ncbi:MAG: undecaprenyl-diphosphate phosphatase, partial [Parabacteroides distasonis]